MFSTSPTRTTRVCSCLREAVSKECARSVHELGFIVSFYCRYWYCGVVLLLSYSIILLLLTIVIIIISNPKRGKIKTNSKEDRVYKLDKHFMQLVGNNQEHETSSIQIRLSVKISSIYKLDLSCLNSIAR